jgi:hypothetical protein
MGTVRRPADIFGSTTTRSFASYERSTRITPPARSTSSQRSASSSPRRRPAYIAVPQKARSAGFKTASSRAASSGDAIRSRRPRTAGWRSPAHVLERDVAVLEGVPEDHPQRNGVVADGFCGRRLDERDARCDVAFGLNEAERTAYSAVSARCPRHDSNMRHAV